MSEQADRFLRQCVSIDLEVNPASAKVFALAALFGDGRPAIVAQKPPVEPALDQLGRDMAGVEHVLGHNILRHDLPHLLAIRPQLAQLFRAPIDTLWLNPLAFPRNPYHHLVKHYHDGRLQAGHVNDPQQDARLVFDVLRNQLAALRQLNVERPEAVTSYHYLTTRTENAGGFDAVFGLIRQAPQPSHEAACEALSRLLAGRVCIVGLNQLLETLASPSMGWPTAYALSWILVAGGDSVMPPWVRFQFPDAARIVKRLRDTACDRPDCAWCREHSDPVKALTRWFGFDGFRSQPVDEMGRPLQERIVDEAMRGESILGILPTGTGKSVCYQIPALSKFDKTGALTVVISPLVALMSDQVQGMARAGVASAVTINGLLSMPERQDALDKVRMGDASMLLISPEQLRSNSVRQILRQREVGLWVLDEAHCVSKWGHDFRPDYRYVGRFIKEHAGDQPPAPVLCLTATAKPEVVRDIREHFQARLGVNLLLLDGGAVRTNLSFDVRETNSSAKLTDILDVIEEKLPSEGASGAIVYCATRNATERVADFLKQQGLSAEHFHAGLPPEQKKTIQERFRIGELRVIAATNAFGMGIDKPDIRLVVHGDIPGSLENYLQEAGRAGRDREHANCVLLFAADDVERQFSLSARSRLARHEIGAILKALRRVDERTKKTGTVIATSGEIVRAELDREFERETATDDTRVKTAVSWLEEASLLSREENKVQVFPSSLLVRTMVEAETIIARAVGITDERRSQLRAIVRHLMNAPIDQGVSTDELSGASGLGAQALNKALADLETLRIARNDVAVTVFVHVGVEDSSRHRFEAASRLETELIALMREGAPDAEVGSGLPLNLQVACQTLRDRGHAGVRPDIVERLVGGMARDGRDQDGGRGNIRLRKASNNTLAVILQRPWQVLEQTALIRRQAAELLLVHLIGKVGKGVRGKDIQVETTLGDLLAVLNGDALLRSSGVRDMSKLMERALLWLHEQEVANLGKGLTIFRQAMTVHLNPSGGQFTQKDFSPLQDHYEEQTAQTHVMAAYAERGLVSMSEAIRLSEDYFVLDRDAFLRRWLPGKGREIRRQTTGSSWKSIVESLDNPLQQSIVEDIREQTNVLVLAGPGSGKTRVLVHRIAFLIRVRRENPRDILVLTYNRHAAAEIRARLRHLVGDDANAVTVSTCHALAMRLVGASFAGLNSDKHDFDGVVMQAVQQLNGDGLTKTEAEAQRETLIQGYRWILVDEYQDIGPEEYALISAVAGRSLEDPDLRLSLFAVGDDDQNIYAFAGASIDFIRRFEADYRAKPQYLIENYRSTNHIIAAANSVIAPAAARMKLNHDVVINRKRVKEHPGGEMAALDPVAQGRVQIIVCPDDEIAQAQAALDELQRLSRLDPEWNWARAAIIAREWKRLAPVRSYAEELGIPVEMANETLPSIWRLREMQQFISALRREPTHLLGIRDLVEAINAIPANRWTELIAEGIAALAREIGNKLIPVPDLVEWFAEWARDVRGEQRSLLLLTAHRAKGLEFEDVAILSGGWDRSSKAEDADAPRRLFYVAMTRARRSLSIIADRQHPFLTPDNSHILHRRAPAVAIGRQRKANHYQMPDLKAVNLSWAGRLVDGDPSLAAVAQAKVGDRVQLLFEGKHWVLKSLEGKLLGRMARSWSPPNGYAFQRGEVGAIIRWRKSDSTEEYRSRLRREEWEVVVPELVFE